VARLSMCPASEARACSEPAPRSQVLSARAHAQNLPLRMFGRREHALATRTGRCDMSGAIRTSRSGQADFVAPPTGLVFWSQELLPAFLLWTTIQLLSAAIFVAIAEGPLANFGNAFYHCCITATTCATHPNFCRS
jgi:hypothetical protein